MHHLQFLCEFTHSLSQAFQCIRVFPFIQRLSIAFKGRVPIASPFSPCLAKGRVRKFFSQTRISIHLSMLWVPRNATCQRVFSLQNSVFWFVDLLHAVALNMPILLLLFSPLPPFHFANFYLSIPILLSLSQSDHGVHGFVHHFEQLLTLEPERNSSSTDRFFVFCPQSIK